MENATKSVINPNGMDRFLVKNRSTIKEEENTSVNENENDELSVDTNNNEQVTYKKSE